MIKNLLIVFLLIGFMSCGVQRISKDHPLKLSETSKEPDFGDHKSGTLVNKAWASLGEKDYTSTLVYTQKCIEMYQAEAKKQQKSLKDFASKDDAFNYWALNDVGVAYFIEGLVYEKTKNITKQKQAYKTLVDNYYFCQCWDEGGWFWHPAESTQEKLAELEALE